MARIKIELPEKFKFTTQYTVRIADVNYGGHVGNDSILTIMQEARLQYLQFLGYKNEISIGEHVGIIVADAAVVYKSESFYGEVITIKIAVDDFNKYGFDIYYHLIAAENGREIARGKTGIVCLNYKEKKIAVVPEELLEKLRG